MIVNIRLRDGNDEPIQKNKGLDVYEREPLPENNKLRFLPNALLTPHIGYVTAENYSIYYNQMIEALESCVSGKPKRLIK